MSTESRKPSPNQAPANLPAPIDRARSTPPAARISASPENKPELADCEQAVAALEAAIESGRRLADGRFMLDELERIRGDLDACRLLLGDSRATA